MRRKWVKEELRRDELVGITKGIVHFVSQKKKLLTSLGIIILVGIIIVSIGFTWLRNLEAKAIEKINEANNLYDRDKNKEAIEIYQQILKNFSYTNTASEALFYIGNCYFRLGEYDKAIETYQKYIKKYPHKILAPFAYEGIGISREEKGDYKGAIDIYNELIKKYPQSFIIAKAHMNIARSLVAGNEKDEAQKEYKKILDFYPTSVWADKAKEKIEQLKTPENQPKESSSK